MVMKTVVSRRATLLCVFLAPTMSILAQGQLNPTGTPAPTMKSLDQVEARIVIDPRQSGFSLPYTINTSGSYYLAANVTASGSSAGIIIGASNVTVDLNGFTLAGGGSGSVAGIQIVSSGACIRNGTITGWTRGGINASGTGQSALYASLQNLIVTGNSGAATDAAVTVSEGSRIQGCVVSNNSTVTGILTANACVITDCAVVNNGGVGVSLTQACSMANCSVELSGNDGVLIQSGVTAIANCSVIGNTGNGIEVQGVGACSLSHCTATLNHGTGIIGGTAGVVTGCTANGNSGAGISGDTGSSIDRCVAKGNGGNGITITANCSVVGSTCSLNNTTNSATNGGIFSAGNANTIDSNNCTSNGNGGGIISTGTHNLTIRNSCSGNGFNYNVPGSGNGNTFGPVVDSSAGGAIASGANPFTNWIH
jgi:hypothetical protein